LPQPPPINLEDESKISSVEGGDDDAAADGSADAATDGSADAAADAGSPSKAELEPGRCHF